MMAKPLTKEEIRELSPQQRLELIDELWESLSEDDVPLPEWHKRLLDEALEEYERNPEEGKPWKETRDEILGRG